MRERAVSETKTRERASDALFLSSSLALDLVNTEMVVRGKKRDVLASPEALSHWWQEALAHYPERERVEEEASAIAWTSELLEAVKRVRQTLRTVCTHLVEEQAVTVPAQQVAVVVAGAGGDGAVREAEEGVRKGCRQAATGATH